MEIFKRISKKTKYYKTKDEFKTWFFTQDYHAWILKNDQYFDSFEQLIDLLDFNTIKKLWETKDIAFIKAEGSLSCAIDSPKHLKFVLCFPELLQYLRSLFSELGIAILLHELGHLYHQHNLKNCDQLTAQFEADEFAYFHGHGLSLIEVINDYRHLEDNRKRISNLNQLINKEKEIAN